MHSFKIGKIFSCSIDKIEFISQASSSIFTQCIFILAYVSKNFDKNMKKYYLRQKIVVDVAIFKRRLITFLCLHHRLKTQILFHNTQHYEWRGRERTWVCYWFIFLHMSTHICILETSNRSTASAVAIQVYIFLSCEFQHLLK